MFGNFVFCYPFSIRKVPDTYQVETYYKVSASARQEAGAANK
ncbi:hypothetical protein HMPREF1548_06995 [Clostridium sp. KLE 1755]|nr:hypothetical protein HMPREF1548_06995 [Clostridium sp. KLE 1755]